MAKTEQENFSRSTQQVADYVESLKAAALTKGTFDSAACADFVSENTNKSGSIIPEKLAVVLDELDDKHQSMVNKAILDGCAIYEKNHGCEAPADVVEQAIHSAFATTRTAEKKFSLPTLDSANSLHADNESLQPNRAVVAILTTIAEAIPFAHYLPADIGSNEAKLAILSHTAGVASGSYAQGAILDGVDCGDPYITSARVHTANPDAQGKITGKITKVQITPDTCLPLAGDLKLMRGRTQVYVNGFHAAREVAGPSGSGESVISGKVVLAGTEYVIGGSINTDTGVFALTTTPAMPAAAIVTVKGFIDFERDPDLTPSIISNVETFKLFANPWRVTTHVTPDARTQMSNELGLDPFSESIVAIQSQFALERHYEVLRMGMRIAKNYQRTFDWFASRHYQNAANRANVWQDLAYPLGDLSQEMANNTIDHGITHLYVGKRVAAQLFGLDVPNFAASGVPARPSIYRLGRLFGRYEVYYTPKIVEETEDTAQILCVGRGTNVTRNPIVLGEAVPPSVMELGVLRDMKRNAGFYARNFTEVNPHHPSACGFALVNVTGMSGSTIVSRD